MHKLTQSFKSLVGFNYLFCWFMCNLYLHKQKESDSSIYYTVEATRSIVQF